MKQTLVRWSALFFLVSIPFGTKKFLFSFALPFSNFYINEYSSAFLFGSDILLLAFIAVSLAVFRRPIWRFVRRQYVLLAFLCVSLASVGVAALPGLGIYAWVRLALAALGALVIGALVAERILPFRQCMAALAASAVFQAVLGIYQTATNGDAGLRILGEPLITPLTNNVGHVVIAGGEVLRAMGTLAHANIFAGFLIVGLGAVYYLFLTRKEDAWRYGWLLSTMAIPVLIVGLVASFSRSGWIVASALTLGVLAFGFSRKRFRQITFELCILLLLVSIFLFSFLGWAIAPRAGFTPGEGSVADRYSYDQIGLEMLVAHPEGVGLGNQLTTGVAEGRYAARSLSAWWLRQPIHNLYLMVGTETGIIGLAAFIIFLVLLFIRAGIPGNWNLPASRSLSEGWEIGISAMLLLALLLFGLFDHFLWDIESGRLMLWAVIGLLIGATSIPSQINE